MPTSLHGQFLAAFAEGEVGRAAALLDAQPAQADHVGYRAHPLLSAFVASNDGHCYKKPHLQIADLLIPTVVREFRDAVVTDLVPSVRSSLQADPSLVDAEFTAGRGISQAIHHWRSLEMARLLLDAGANLDVLTTRGESPLTMQMRFGAVAGLKFLLEHGADPNRGVGGYMPSSEMSEMIELLLAHGWEINRGQLLHDANHGHGARIITWLKYGANPRAANEQGQTALHLLAARGTGREAIHALAAAGADIQQPDAAGRTPLQLARKAKRRAAARALLDLGAQE